MREDLSHRHGVVNECDDSHLGAALRAQQWENEVSVQADARGAFCRSQSFMDPRERNVEGARDDICGTGQTRPAHDLCVNIPADKPAPPSAPVPEAKADALHDLRRSSPRPVRSRPRGAYWASRW
jgi:hypothetical protein